MLLRLSEETDYIPLDTIVGTMIKLFFFKEKKAGNLKSFLEWSKCTVYRDQGDSEYHCPVAYLHIYSSLVDPYDKHYLEQLAAADIEARHNGNG